MNECRTIKIGRYSYPFCVSENISETIDAINEVQTNHLLYIYDDELNDQLINYIYSKTVNYNKKGSKLAISSSENHKDINMLSDILNFAFERHLTTDSTIVAIGGGVLGNIVGLVAGLMYRGIKLIHIPTTVIAATDSTISLKQAINWGCKKNSVGTYFKPIKVIVEFDFFQTLSKFDYICGLVEMIKNILCITPHYTQSFLDLVQEGVQFTKEELKCIIKLSLEAKQAVLIDDETECKDGLILEYGHTVGHAIEMLLGGELNHGLGVAIGMLISAEISNLLEKIDEEIVRLHWKLLDSIGIIEYIKVNKLPDLADIIQQMKLDNKRGRVKSTQSEIPMVVLENLGKCSKTNNVKLLAVNVNVIKEAILRYEKRLQNLS